MRLAAGLLAVAVALACADEAPELRHAPTTRSRAALVLEPPVLAVGDVAEVEVTVVTPPGRTPRPFEPPEALPGFWVLGAEREPVRKEASRWIHRTRLRLRAREVGRFELPAATVEVEGGDGAVESVALEALPLEVVSVIAAHPEQRTPFGIRHLPATAVAGGSTALGFAAGFGSAFALLGLVWLARLRLAAARSEAEPAPDPPPPPWRAARASLAAAAETAPRDPRAALDAVASALRHFAAERFGADVVGRTREEIDAADPPFLMTTRWSAFVGLLGDLDALRFPPPVPDLDAARGCLERARAFVEDAVPAGAEPA